MTYFAVLTPETKTIVVNFFKVQRGKNKFCEPNVQLMVSLYDILRKPSLFNRESHRVTEILCQYKISLSEYFSDKEISQLKAEYPAVIKFCYDYVGGFSDKNNNQVIPQSIIDLCLGIAEPQSGSSIYVPYSGNGGFAYHLCDCDIAGFEKNEVSWAISQILLHSQKANTKIELGYSTIPENKQYDFVFSFPPIRQENDSMEAVNTIYDLITKHLVDNGELYCILPLSFCSSNSGWFDIRKILWDYRGQYSALVVSLPPVLQPMINVSLCLLHIKKNHKDIIALMDATGEEFSARHEVAGYKEYVLKVQSIIETINSQDEKYVWVGSSSQLIGDVNLQPSRYLISQIIPRPNEGERNIALSDILQTVPMTRCNEKNLQIIARRNRLAHESPEELSISSKERNEVFAQYRELEKQGCPIIGMRELSSSYLNCDIEYAMLEPTNVGVPRQILTTDCLLIGFIGGKFKVGRLHGVTQSTPVALRNEVYPVQISSNVITEDFLLRCIMSEQTERQARMLAIGETISRLSMPDLFSIVITIPERREQQDALCKEDTRSSLTDADRKIIESYEEFRKDMHMKKHAIGQTLFNLNNWWDALLQARREGNGVVADNATIGKIRKVSVSAIYDSMQKAINQLQQQINKFDRGNGLAIKKFALTEFIEDYIARRQSPLFDFRYDATFHHYRKFEAVISDEANASVEFKKTCDQPIEYVEFAPDALEIIFDNIISNACCHGFKNRESKPNFIRIVLKTEGDKHSIVISNNGDAILPQINPKEVFVYGKTSKMGKSADNGETHFGIGGYEVQKLMQEFGGYAEFISDPESDFPVSYKLTFYNTIFKSTDS